MKKTMIIGLALGVALTAGSAFAATYGDGNVGSEVNNRHGNTGGSGIVGSSHDLGTGTGYGNGDIDGRQRICIFCHHPHHAAKAGEGDVGNYSPLWNRDVPAAGNFTAYSNSTGNVMMGDASSARHMMNGTPAIGGLSLLCMSCHDGTTAMNAYSNNNTDSTGGTGSDYTPNAGGALSGDAALAGGSGDMTNHHPIGMTWADVVQEDKEIAAAGTEFKNADGTLLGVKISDVLVDGKMECVTCHDVHNTQNENGAERFLWVSNDQSKFCLTCHLK